MADPPICPHCGGPMRRSTALLNDGKNCQPLRLPPYCPSPECRAARDEAAIARAIAAGVIDP